MFITVLLIIEKLLKVSEFKMMNWLNINAMKYY